MSAKSEAVGDIQVHNSDESIDRKPEEPHYVDPKDEKRLLKKLDRTLIPFLSVIYLLSFLDRSNVGNAKLAGLEKDLHMTGKYDYNVGFSTDTKSIQRLINCHRPPSPSSSRCTSLQRSHPTSS